MGTGIKRFVLDADTRAGLADMAQRYDVPMQSIAGYFVAAAVRAHRSNNKAIDYEMRLLRHQHELAIKERMVRTRASRKGAQHG